MMQKLTASEDDAELLIETANKRPEKLLSSSSSCSKWKSLHQKLLDLFVEESRKEAHNKQLKCSSNLLEKLVKRDELNTLVVNLYPGNEGYSLMLKGGRDGRDSETMKLSYDENEFLQHLDNEELPVILVDLLDRVQANLFYSGCVICELRDYRRSVNYSYDTKYVLLKPTQQSLQCDLNTLSNDGHLWTQDDLFALESQLLLATSPPLCLDPSPTVAFISNKLHNDKYKLCTQPIKRTVKKYTQAAINRKRKMAQCSAPSHLKLHDFVTKKRDKVKGAPAVNLRVGKSCVDMWRQRDVALTTPEQIDVLKYARQIEKTKLTMDNTPIVVEEFTFESERGQGKVNFSRLTILKRVSDEFYLGELYVDRDFQQGQAKGSTCKFPLGTKSNVEKYIKQFREIFTEEGRRQVKITHQTQGGQTPSINFTQASATVPSGNGGNQNSSASSGNEGVGSAVGNAQAMLAQAANLAASLTGQINIPGPGGEGNKGPIKLSLSISNSQSPSNSGGLFSSATTAQQTNPALTQLTIAQHQQLAASQRLRHVGMVTNVNRPSSAPSTPSQIVSTPSANLTIPGFTVTSSVAGLTSSSQQSNSNNRTVLQLTPHQQIQQHQHNLSQQTVPQQQAIFTTKLLGTSSGITQSATPPPNVTITMAGTIPIARRLTSLDSIAKSRGGGGGQCSSAPPSAPATPTAADPSGTANQILAAVSTTGGTFSTAQQLQSQNLNNGITSSVPQNINIQNLTGLQGVNIANLSGLQNIQVSVAGMPGSIAVPLCLSNLNMMNNGSQPNVVFSPANGQGATSTVTSVTNIQNLPQLASNNSPSSRLSVLPTSQNTGFSANIAHAPGSIQTTPGGGMLSLPIGMTGNITQFMTAAGLKGTPGIRSGTPLLLSQVSGQQPLQLLSTTSFPQSTRLQLNPAQQSHLSGKNLPQSSGTGTVSGSVGGQQYLQIAPQQSMTHLTIQGNSAIITPPRAPKGKKLPGNTPPKM